MALFAGIGGIELGLSRWARTVCYVENEQYCVEVIKARIKDGLLDDAPIWDDIRTFNGKPWCGIVDIVTGGFPCQDVSVAGRGEGIEGSKSGLWSEMARIICEVRPSFVFVENVPGLLGRGLGTVLGDLATIGYDAVWTCLQAAEVGAPHRRKRVFILAYSNIKRLEGGIRQGEYRLFKTHKLPSYQLWKRWSNFVPKPLTLRNYAGVPNAVDRLKALGNAVVPQQAEMAFMILWEMMEKSSDE